MADSYSPFLLIQLQATGAYNNTWGANLNTNALSLLDVAIAGWTTENVGSNTSFSLPALAQGSASDSRYFGLEFVGTPSSQVTVTVPASVLGKMYLINNQTGQDLVFTYAGSTNTVTVENDVYQLIWCDGDNCWAVSAAASDSPSLGGVAAQYWVQGQLSPTQIDDDVTVQNSISIPTAWPWYAQADGDTITYDCTNGNAQTTTLEGNRTIAAPTNQVDGSELLLLLVQDGTGGRVPAWNSVFWFENGVAPTMATAPGAADMFWCRYSSALGKWMVAHFYNLNAGGAASSTITIAANCQDFSLAAVVGDVSSSGSYTIVVNQGVIIEASSAANAAMDLSGMISGSTVTLVNNGYILGHGGRGGRGGAYIGGTSSGEIQLLPTAGQNGGAAVNGPGSGCTFLLTNTGYIWGGGGGGGVAGASFNTGGFTASGGGGGGAGNGAGGISFGSGGVATTIQPSDGGDGSMALVYNGAAGTAGNSAQSGVADTGNSGAGGTWGTAGTDGTAAGTSHGSTQAETDGGSGGNAILLNGGSLASGSTGTTSPNVVGAIS